MNEDNQKGRDIDYAEYEQTAVAANPLDFWQKVLSWATIVGLVFLCTAVLVSFKARSLVVYQPESATTQAR